MFVPLTGFAPDQDPTTPGILTACSAIVPTLRGIEAAPGAQDSGVDALAASCTGAGQIRKLDNSSRMFAGTITKLYELSGTSWTDRTRAVGGDYTGTTSDRWRFAQFGNVSLAVNGVDILQSSTTGAFADVAGAPDARIVETVGEFVFLFATNEGTFGDSPDRWWCSALGDYTDWTPSIATQSATNRITSIPGPIRAGRRLGDRIVVYKDRGISVGTYTGPAFIWEFTDIPGDVGAVSQEVVIPLRTAHYFMSHDGFFVFDGVDVRPIDQDIRNWWINRVSKDSIQNSTAIHNRLKGTITWFYPISGSGTVTSGIVYNYRVGKWGVDDQTIEAAVDYVEPGVTWDNLGSKYSTWDDLPNVPWDSTIFESGSASPSVFDTTHTLFTLTGTPGSWSYTSGDFGDGQQFSFLTRMIPRFIRAPSGAIFANSYRNSLGDALTTGTSTSMTRGRFDIYRSARWHRGTVSSAGNMEQLGFDAFFERDGEE